MSFEQSTTIHALLYFAQKNGVTKIQEDEKNHNPRL